MCDHTHTQPHAYTVLAVIHLIHMTDMAPTKASRFEPCTLPIHQMPDSAVTVLFSLLDAKTKCDAIYQP